MDEIEQILADTEAELMKLKLDDNAGVWPLIDHQEQTIEIMSIALDKIRTKLSKRLRIVR